MPAASDGVARITRREVYQRGVRYPLRWIYDVTVDGVEVVCGTDRLASARRIAREHGAQRVVETWKEQTP